MSNQSPPDLTRRSFGGLAVAVGVGMVFPKVAPAQGTGPYPVFLDMPAYYRRSLYLIDSMSIGTLFQNPLAQNIDVWIDRIPDLADLGLISSGYSNEAIDTFSELKSALSSQTTLQYLIETSIEEWSSELVSASVRLQENGFFSAHCHIPNSRKSAVAEFLESSEWSFFHHWGGRKISEVYTLPGHTFSEAEIVSYQHARHLGLVDHH